MPQSDRPPVQAHPHAPQPQQHEQRGSSSFAALLLPNNCNIGGGCGINSSSSNSNQSENLSQHPVPPQFMREEYSQQHHSWNEIRKGGRSTSALQTSADSASLDLVTSTLPKDVGPANGGQSCPLLPPSRPPPGPPQQPYCSSPATAHQPNPPPNRPTATSGAPMSTATISSLSSSSTSSISQAQSLSASQLATSPLSFPSSSLASRPTLPIAPSSPSVASPPSVPPPPLQPIPHQSIAANSSTTVSSSVRVGPDPATVKQLAILAAFATMRMVVKRWKHVQSDAQAAGPLDPASDSVSVAGSPLFPDPLKTPRTSPKAVGSADGSFDASSFLQHQPQLHHFRNAEMSGSRHRRTPSGSISASSASSTTSVSHFHPYNRPPMANPSDSHKRSSSTSSSSTLALGNVSGSSFIPPVAATAPAMERQLPRQVARSYQSTNAQSQSRPAPAFAAPAPVTPFYPSLPTTHSGSSSLSSSHPMLAPGMRGMLGVPAYAATPTPSIASGSSSSSSTSRTPSLYSASSVHSANTTTTTATCTPEEKAFLNAYSQRHATHLHTLATSSLTVLALPYHAVILALLFVKRLLALPEVPAALCTPTKLLLAGLVLADAELCDSTVSMRTWAAVTGARGGGAQVAEIKRAALAALQFCVTVDADTYSAWLLNVKSFFREDGSSGATSVAGVSLPQSQSLGTTVAPLPSSSSSASGGASTVPGPLVVGGVGHQPPSSLAPVAVSVVGKAEVPGNGQTVDPVAVYGGRGMGTFCV